MTLRMQTQVIPCDNIISHFKFLSCTSHIFFPFHRRHMKQMTWICSMAHAGSLWATRAERGILRQSAHRNGRPPARCPPPEPQLQEKHCNISLSLPPTRSTPPFLCVFFFFYFFKNSFDILIHLAKGRGHEMAVCKVACTIGVRRPEGIDSDHLWLVMNKRMPSFWDHTHP